MTGNRGTLLGACLLAASAVVFLAVPQSRAADSCAAQAEKVKQRTGPVNAPMPHMGVAAEYVAAAEAALREGNEAKCFEELRKTEMWLRLNQSHRGSR